MIPKTSQDCYLSGMAALNLPSATGTGDWHQVETFRPRQQRSRCFVVGEGCEADTRDYLGSLGIFECSALLDELQIDYPAGPVYAASHARAIADLVLVAVISGGSPEFVTLDDWMPRESDKQEVYDLLAIALPKLTPVQQQIIESWQQKQNISN